MLFMNKESLNHNMLYAGLVKNGMEYAHFVWYLNLANMIGYISMLFTRKGNNNYVILQSNLTQLKLFQWAVLCYHFCKIVLF